MNRINKMLSSVAKIIGDKMVRVGIEKLGGEVPDQYCYPVEIPTPVRVNHVNPLIFQTSEVSHHDDMPMEYVRDLLAKHIASGIAEHIVIRTQRDYKERFCDNPSIKLYLSTGKIAILPKTFFDK